MTTLLGRTLSVEGVSTRVFVGGNEALPTVVGLHGSLPGLSPYCGGAHVWGSSLDAMLDDHQIVLPDLLGCGGTAAGADPLTVEAIGVHALGVLRAVSGQPVHLVGHDLGGLVGLWIAMEEPSLLASLTIVASNQASPTGDGVENLALASPPRPLWSRESQAWAYERLSYSHLHIDESLLDGSMAAASGEGHRTVVTRNTEDSNHARSLPTSIMEAKFQFFKIARETGIKVPTQIIWAKHDPLVSLDHGAWLFRIIANKQPSAQFHVINRSGSFPFREQPEEFQRLLRSFIEGISGKRTAA